MGDHRFGSLLRAVGEAIRLEVAFGTQSLEALAWLAQTVESSVYVLGSLEQTPSGFRFALANPPLRIGAFSGLRVLVDGVPVDSDRTRVRSGPGRPWRNTSQLGPAEPLELQAGTPTELEVDWPLTGTPTPITVRLELQSVAIPPLVWLELRDTPRGAVPP